MITVPAHTMLCILVNAGEKGADGERLRGSGVHWPDEARMVLRRRGYDVQMQNARRPDGRIETTFMIPRRP